MKYIIYANKQLKIETPIIFPNFLNHRDIAEKIDPDLAIISAGFCNLYNSEFRIYGRSQSLNLDSRKEDRELLNLMAIPE